MSVLLKEYFDDKLNNPSLGTLISIAKHIVTKDDQVLVQRFLEKCENPYIYHTILRDRYSTYYFEDIPLIKKVLDLFTRSENTYKARDKNTKLLWSNSKDPYVYDYILRVEIIDFTEEMIEYFGKHINECKNYPFTLYQALRWKPEEMTVERLKELCDVHTIKNCYGDNLISIYYNTNTTVTRYLFEQGIDLFEPNICGYSYGEFLDDTEFLKYADCNIGIQYYLNQVVIGYQLRNEKSGIIRKITYNTDIIDYFAEHRDLLTDLGRITWCVITLKKSIKDISNVCVRDDQDREPLAVLMHSDYELSCELIKLGNDPYHKDKNGKKPVDDVSEELLRRYYDDGYLKRTAIE